MTERTLDRSALAVACACLVVIGLRPASTRQVDPTIVVVRTPGATEREARLVADSLHAGPPTEASAHGAFSTPGAVFHLVGWGLDADELRRAGGRPMVLHPRPLPEGIREVSWSGPLLLGDEMTVRVTLRHRAAPYLVLADDAGPVDSVRVPAGELTSLSVRHRPRAIGVVRYALRLGDRSDTFSVFVAPAEPPATLILASAPSREWSDLRDWLAGQGATVTLRTTVSRGLVRSDRINTPPPGERLTSAALTRTSLVVTDGRTLTSLPPAERAVLRRAITEGLGLILLHDRQARDGGALPPGESRFFLPWRTTRVGDIDTRDVRPRHDGSRASETPVSAEAYLFAEGPGATPVLDDGQGGILASVIRQGRGRITATMIDGPGRWLRAGEPAPFAAYWSALIRVTARADTVTERWDAGRGPVMVDRAAELVRWGAPGGDVLIGGERVGFAADPLVPGRSVAKWWPNVPGAVALGQATIWVSDTSAWPAWRAAERRRITEGAIGAGRGTAGTGSRVPQRVRWPLWPFFVGLVGTTGWLWRRIGN